MAEWLGSSLQSCVRRFEPAWGLRKGKGKFMKAIKKAFKVAAQADLWLLAKLDRSAKRSPKANKPTGRHRAAGKSTMQLIRAQQTAWSAR